MNTHRTLSLQLRASNGCENDNYIKVRVRFALVAIFFFSSNSERSTADAMRNASMIARTHDGAALSVWKRTPYTKDVEALCDVAST